MAKVFWRAENTLDKKGGWYVVNGRFDTDNSVGAGADEQLHDGRVYSYPAGNRYIVVLLNVIQGRRAQPAGDNP
jgi:hypothetical protein